MTKPIASEADWAVLREKGLTAVEIAKAMQCHPQTVRRWFKRLGGLGHDGRRRAHVARSPKEANAAWWADPANNPLAALTAAERADYDVLKRKGGISRAEALAAIGRADLVRGRA